MMKKTTGLLVLFLVNIIKLIAQGVTLSPQQIVGLTREWTGERSSNGRAHVADRISERLKRISLEDA